MEEPTVVVGRITRAHGVRGEVAVLVISEVPERFREGATVWTEDGRALTVSASRQHGDRMLVRFDSVDDREQASESTADQRDTFHTLTTLHARDCAREVLGVRFQASPRVLRVGR